MQSDDDEAPLITQGALGSEDASSDANQRPGRRFSGKFGGGNNPQRRARSRSRGRAAPRSGSLGAVARRRPNNNNNDLDRRSHHGRNDHHNLMTDFDDLMASHDNAKNSPNSNNNQKHKPHDNAQGNSRDREDHNNARPIKRQGSTRSLSRMDHNKHQHKSPASLNSNSMDNSSGNHSGRQNEMKRSSSDKDLHGAGKRAEERAGAIDNIRKKPANSNALSGNSGHANAAKPRRLSGRGGGGPPPEGGDGTKPRRPPSRGRVVRSNDEHSVDSRILSSGSSHGSGGGKENKSATTREEELEAQVTLYKEQYKRVMKEKKQLSSKLSAETSIKETMTKQLYLEIQNLRTENAKLKNHASGTTATTSISNGVGRAHSTAAKPFQEMPPSSSTTTCDVWHGTGMLLTGHHRPRPSVFQLPGLRSLPIWTQSGEDGRTAVAYQDAQLTWAVHLFEEHQQAIADEYQRVAPFLPTDYNEIQEAATARAEEPKTVWDWHSYTLEGKVNGVFEQNFPATTEVLQMVRKKNLLFDRLPFAHSFFSTLHGQSRLLPHSSPMNLRLRLLLPLLLPNETEDPNNAGLRVGPTTRTWELGRAMLIDDAYDNEQWNLEDSESAVFVVDLWHPDVTMQERKELQSLFDPDRNTLEL